MCFKSPTGINIRLPGILKLAAVRFTAKSDAMVWRKGPLLFEM